MIRIRLHVADDFPSLVPLFRDFLTLHRQYLGNTEPLTEGQASEMARESLGQLQSWTIVAEEEDSGRLVGFARWEERDGAFFGRELFVRPEYRGQGIGTRLQEEVERRVREAGGDAFFVSIIPHNQQMLAFAHRRGYDTLNTVELRKELRGDQPRRGQVDVLGLGFKVIWQWSMKHFCSRGEDCDGDTGHRGDAVHWSGHRRGTAAMGPHGHHLSPRAPRDGVLRPGDPRTR